MKRVLVASLVVASLGVCALPTQACFCILPELSDSFKDSRSVFLGEVIRIDERTTLEGNTPVTERTYTIKFKVTRSWKGVPSGASEFTVLWTPNCWECKPLPTMNENYLVFAYPLYGSTTWSLVATCNRTVMVPKDSKSANPDISPLWDVKQLDVITKHTFAPRYRRRV